MPELPEITKIARQMKQHLTGKTIAGIEVIQPKSLNMPVEAFTAALTGARIVDVCNRGKWLLLETTNGWLLISLGMGGETLLVTRESLPEKRRVIFDFTDSTCLAVNFWWFGYAHFAPEPEQHAMVSKLGPNALDVTAEELKRMLAGKRGNIKSYLLDQSSIAGIGNSYVHDILFLARLHPLRKIDSLSGAEIEALHQGIYTVLNKSLEKGGAAYEQDLFGQKGGFAFEDIIIGYRENQPCPQCSTPIQKIKTGSTTGFVCPSCQPLR